MALLDDIRREIHDRLAELRPLTVEYERLQQVQAALSGTPGAEDREEHRGRGSTAGPARPRRAPRGAARELILAAARDNPQAKRGDIAKITGLSPNTVGTTLSKLRAEGVLPPSPRARGGATSEAEREAPAGEETPSAESSGEDAYGAAAEPQADAADAQQAQPPEEGGPSRRNTGPAEAGAARATRPRRTTKARRPAGTDATTD